MLRINTDDAILRKPCRLMAIRVNSAKPTTPGAIPRSTGARSGLLKKVTATKSLVTNNKSATKQEDAKVNARGLIVTERTRPQALSVNAAPVKRRTVLSKPTLVSAARKTHNNRFL